MKMRSLFSLTVSFALGCSILLAQFTLRSTIRAESQTQAAPSCPMLRSY